MRLKNAQANWRIFSSTADRLQSALNRKPPSGAAFVFRKAPVLLRGTVDADRALPPVFGLSSSHLTIAHGELDCRQWAYVSAEGRPLCCGSGLSLSGNLSQGGLHDRRIARPPRRLSAVRCPQGGRAAGLIPS